MASYSLLHNSFAQVRTVRLRLERLLDLPTFPELRVARWLEWALVLVASKLFKRSGFPQPCFRLMCPGR